jgi:hypothetical protein
MAVVTFVAGKYCRLSFAAAIRREKMCANRRGAISFHARSCR